MSDLSSLFFFSFYTFFLISEKNILNFFLAFQTKSKVSKPRKAKFVLIEKKTETSILDLKPELAFNR